MDLHSRSELTTNFICQLKRWSSLLQGDLHFSERHQSLHFFHYFPHVVCERVIFSVMSICSQEVPHVTFCPLLSSTHMSTPTRIGILSSLPTWGFPRFLTTCRLPRPFKNLFIYLRSSSRICSNVFIWNFPKFETATPDDVAVCKKGKNRVCTRLCHIRLSLIADYYST